MKFRTVSIALPEPLYEFARDRAEEEGHASIAAFLESLVSAERERSSSLVGAHAEDASSIDGAMTFESSDFEKSEVWLESQLRRTCDRHVPADL